MICTPGSYHHQHLSLSSGHFHHTLKESVISSLLKKPTLNKDEFSNYRPISNLSLTSKIIERVVKSHLSDHLTSNNLVNPYQSSYCKHHYTETALLYIHDHIINAIGSRKISCLCLLDLWAAFDTTDHSILLTRLSSWFAIHGTALNWFRSNLPLTVFVSNAIMISPPHILVSVVSPEAQFLALYSLSCIPPRSVLLFHLLL